MNDHEIDRYITNKIQECDITLYDIIGGKFIDPTPDDKSCFPNERARWNRFKCLSFEYRLCELLTEREFDSNLPYNNLSIPVKNLVRYWWNNIADQEAVIEDIFEDILMNHKDRLLPEKEEPVDLSDALDEVFREAV